ncbi:MAG: hypothetical protein HN712_17355 [Gemmatimonadetes bacterium]|jgi:hypothetical protein|nr:hypothetical protein [Gemmatimonadota bacterium]MBT7862087.1 hypothetical protein [Gemmatimonadota bacterium]
MAHVYTPGLRVTAHTSLQRTRRLPLKGEVLVAKGDQVRRDQVVARTDLPGDVVTLNIVNRLGISAEEILRYMLKAEGDQVTAGEIIAETRPFIKWFKTEIASEIDGTIESISSVTGQVMLRKPPAPVEVPAYVDGTIVEVIPDEGVVVETVAAFVQGIFGVGGERWGTLQMITQSPDEDVTPETIPDHSTGKILVGGGRITYDAILRAQDCGAEGIIAGGIADGDLRQLLGYDLGVAITGTEDIGLSVIVTEGFGQIAMARKTFTTLSGCNGHDASISGATQIRAGVLRPEIIVPSLDGEGVSTESGQAGGMGEGDSLRVIRAPYFGRIGRVVELISELRQVESGATVRVLEVEFEDGERAVVPRANVELIAE